MPLTPTRPRPTPEQVAKGIPTALFHATSRPRPLLALERREEFEMVIDLREDDLTFCSTG